MLLKTLYSGLSNGTERSFLVGGPYGGGKWPNRIGYLSVSEVVETGAGVSAFSPGDVVYTGTFSGHVEYHTAQESDLLVKVPAEVDPKAATLLGLAGVAFFNVGRAQVGPEDRVLVTGAGAIGLTAVQAARAAGAETALVSRTQARRERARGLGADAVFGSTAEALEKRGPYSVLLECAGAELDPLIEPGKECLAPFARVALVSGRVRVDYNFLWASRLRLSFMQSTHFDQATLEQVAALAAAGRVDLDALLSRVVPVADAVGVYDALRDEPLSVGGTVFDWTDRTP